MVGAGNLGSHLAYALKAKGYPPPAIYKKAKYPGFENHIEADIQKLIKDSQVVFICTQESRIDEAVTDIAAHTNPAGKIFFHTSNSLTSDRLLPLKEKGALVASFSPLQTFPPFSGPSASAAGVFRGIYFLTEGDPEATETAAALCNDLGARLLKVEKETKMYFHIAAVCACNFLVSLLQLSQNQLHKVKQPDKNLAPPDINMLMPLIRQTLDNIETRGLAASLTGPAKRRETGIIDKHLALLEGDEKELYQKLTQFLFSSAGA